MTRDGARPPGFEPSVPVVVLKMVLDDYAHGRLGVIRSLGRLGVPVYALHESRRTPAAFSRFSREDLVWPIADTPPATALPELLELGERIGSRPVLLPTDDVGALFVARHADALRPVFRFPDQPAGLSEQVAHKFELFRLCQQHGIPTAQARIPDGRADLGSCVEELGLPVIVKSMDPALIRRRSGAKSVALAVGLADVVDLYDRMEDVAEPNLMLQEYIPGTPGHSWMFNGYFDANSECRVAFTGQKIRQFPRDTGATTLGVSRQNDEIVETTKTLMKQLGYRGLADMNYRFDERDGLFKLLDVNPRLGSTFRLFVDGDGLDAVRAAYLDLTDQAIPDSSMKQDRRWWVEPFDVWAYRDYHRHEGLTRSRWLRSIANVDERAWFAWDDPKPFLAMAALFLTQPIYQRAIRSKRAGATARRLARGTWARREVPSEPDGGQ